MSICLNMIVKNESHVIEETLSNLLDKLPITYWVISDTGSTDRTVELIEAFFAERQIPGELVHHPWVDFGTNRQWALEAATGKTEYVFFFDADDQFHGEVDVSELTSRGYYLKLKDDGGGLVYHRPLLVKNDGSFYWRGVMHEFLVDSQGEPFSILDGAYHVLSCRTGGRSLEPDKYKKDALVLEEAINSNRDPDLRDRYMFYAGQSWMAAGDEEKALYWYQQRIDAKGWDQELSTTHYRLGEYYNGKDDQAKAIYHWLCAAEAYPEAAEPWYQLSRINSWNGRHQVAVSFARRAVEAVMNKTASYVFEHADIHRYWSHYELFMNAYYVGALTESYEALKQLVARDAPEWLYTNEVDKLNQLSDCLKQDSYGAVKELRQQLTDKGVSVALEALGLHEASTYQHR